MDQKSEKLEIATFAAGCFWGVEDKFMQTNGVKNTEVGYTGGHLKSATYKDVCSGTTGHAETVNVYFDPKLISYGELLNIFWLLHDPTQFNRQGPDYGSQYRSAIFYHDENQKTLAEKSKSQLDQSNKYPKKIVTEITRATEFYKAEEYHQQYMKKTGLKVCH
ncbi:MAG: peptide-methionine (S)-S-oxide reductase [Candidatus Pacebacteria bacterium]|nr:peptide-methionine (S)-S-oxide reductase [Candidatus Paceibacterota bacterium]